MPTKLFGEWTPEKDPSDRFSRERLPQRRGGHSALWHRLMAEQLEKGEKTAEAEALKRAEFLFRGGDPLTGLRARVHEEGDRVRFHLRRLRDAQDKEDFIAARRAEDLAKTTPVEAEDETSYRVEKLTREVASLRSENDRIRAALRSVEIGPGLNISKQYETGAVVLSADQKFNVGPDAAAPTPLGGVGGGGLPSNAGKSKYMVLTLSADVGATNDAAKWTVDWVRAHA